MGHVYEIELRDLDRAIDAYSDVLNVEMDHIDALAGLARLYEDTEQWDRAIEMMRRLLRVTTEPKQKVDVNYRLGKIFEEQMKEPEPAQEYLVEALSQDPSHVPSMLTLLGIYKKRGDWQKAGQLMIRAESNTVNPLEKTRLLFDAAKIFQDKLSDETQASDLFARVIGLDPEHVEAAEPLGELYFKRQDWAPLVPLLEMLVRKADRKTNRELTLLYHRLAKAAGELGENDKALKYYKQSYDLDSTYLPTLIDRAALLYKIQHWDDAFRIYQTILVHHRETQKDDEIVDIFFRLGRIKLELRERTKAVNMFEKALEIQPGHRATLNALIDLYTESGDWEAVVKQKRALLASPTTDLDEKFALSEQIAGIFKDKLNNPQKAIAAHLEALNFKPGDRQVLHNLLDLFSDTKQWKKAMEILTKLAELESGKLKAKYLVAAGNIANYELHSTDEAVEIYNLALDEDPDDLKAFERIDKIMTAKKDWRNQERNYRKMIKRLGQEAPPEKKSTQIALWHALGEIYRSRLKDFKSATAAFEVCVTLDPDAVARHQILAELYQVSGPDTYDKAVKEYRYLVKSTQDLGQIAGYMKTLRRLLLEMRQYDRAWCVASTLVYLRKADPEEQQFFDQYRPKAFVRARARLTEELWQRNIYHPDEDRYISAIFGGVSQAVAAVRAKEHKDWGLKRKDKRDVATDQLLFSKVFNYVNQVLGVPQPELYLRPESPGELDMANTREKAQLIPSFVVGASLLQGRPEKELAYVIGKKLTLMRTDHFVRWPTVVPTVAELKVVFLAALKLVAAEVRGQSRSRAAGRSISRAAAPADVAADAGAVERGRAALPVDQGRSRPAQVVERRRLDRDARRLPGLQRHGRGVQAGAGRASRGRHRRSEGQDPRPRAVVDLRGVLHAARAPRAGHWPELTGRRRERRGLVGGCSGRAGRQRRRLGGRRLARPSHRASPGGGLVQRHSERDARDRRRGQSRAGGRSCAPRSWRRARTRCRPVQPTRRGRSSARRSWPRRARACGGARRRSPPRGPTSTHGGRGGRPEAARRGPRGRGHPAPASGARSGSGGARCAGARRGADDCGAARAPDRDRDRRRAHGIGASRAPG